MPQPDTISARHRIIRHCGLATAATVVMVAGFLGYLGYFGGPVFTTVPASALPPPVLRDTAAVIFSGDMGFRIGMGPKIAKRLAADGIPVIGVNSLTFFRTRRSPAENARLINQAIGRALAQPDRTKVVLVGQSFGADMLQTGLPGVSDDLRRTIAMAALIVPGDTVDFRASPAELFDLEQPDAAALPSARRLNWIPVLCIHGEREQHSLCPLLTMPNVRRVTLPGGHYLDGDVCRVHSELEQAITAAIQTEANAKHGSMQ